MFAANAKISKPALSDIKKGIIRTLLYFDIFDYPLTFEELVRFHPTPVFDQPNWLAELDDLIAEKIVYRFDTYFSLRDDMRLAGRRMDGNKLAMQKLPVGLKYARLISAFPFVRGVMISGSLSKNYMDEHSDIDYFLVTEPGRLWLVKGLLAVFKRIFLFNSHQFFCVNYLIDTRSLQIEEKNVYTAFETATLMPVYGEPLWRQFLQENNWLITYFPNLTFSTPAFLSEQKNLIRRSLEKILSGRLGNAFDSFFMNLIINRWRKKFGASFNEIDFDVAFKSRQNISKSHPNFFQKRVLTLFAQRVDSFENRNDVKLMP